MEQPAKPVEDEKKEQEEFDRKVMKFIGERKLKLVKVAWRILPIIDEIAHEVEELEKEGRERDLVVPYELTRFSDMLKNLARPWAELLRSRILEFSGY